ncbi:MAG: hypothetical protein FWF25_02085 [Propionibacteriaceae bacterium]|nr:hypothetical protein [Propionibacteriaceae bacterium]
MPGLQEQVNEAISRFRTAGTDLLDVEVKKAAGGTPKSLPETVSAFQPKDDVIPVPDATTRDFDPVLVSRLVERLRRTRGPVFATQNETTILRMVGALTHFTVEMRRQVILAHDSRRGTTPDRAQGTLTPRQAEVLALLQTGPRSTAGLARLFSITPQAVSSISTLSKQRTE